MHRSLVSAAVGMVLLTLSLANCTLVAHDEDISKHPFAGIVSVTLAADIGDVEWLSADGGTVRLTVVVNYQNIGAKNIDCKFTALQSSSGYELFAQFDDAARSDDAAAHLLTFTTTAIIEANTQSYTRLLTVQSAVLYQGFPVYNRVDIPIQAKA